MFVGNVPATQTADEIQGNIEGLLSFDPISSTATLKIRLGYEKLYQTSPEVLTSLEELLKSIINQFVEPDHYKLRMPNPSPSHLVSRGFVQLSNMSNTLRLTAGLHESNINNSSFHYGDKLALHHKEENGRLSSRFSPKIPEHTVYQG